MFTVKVIPDDGDPYVLVARSRDVIVWERTSGKTARYLLEKLPMVELYKVAHLAATRQQRFTGTLDEFQSGCDLEPMGDEDDPDPTQPAP